MPPQPDNKRRMIIIGGIIAVVVIGALLLIFKTNKPTAKNTASSGKTTIYHDPVSGQDIINQQGKTQESQVASSTIPTFAGFDALLDSGMTLSQVQSLYSAFEQYQPFASNKVLISLDGSDLTSVQPDNSDPNYRWSFTTHIVTKVGSTSTTYHVQLYYWNATTAELVLYNAAGTQQIFDSGAMDTGDANG